jgi:hypothetical protein
MGHVGEQFPEEIQVSFLVEVGLKNGKPEKVDRNGQHSGCPDKDVPEQKSGQTFPPQVAPHTTAPDC